MFGRIACAALLVVVVPTATEAQKPLSPVDLSLGQTERNRLSAVYDAAGIAPVRFETLEWEGDGGPLVRRLKNEKVRYTAGPDLGLHLLDALQSEARAMGLPAGEGQGWTVRGVVDDVSLYERRIPYGPLMFYAFLRATLEVESPAGEKGTRTYDVHDIYWRYNAGFGARDEAMEALAAFLIGSSQELVARLNRDWFHASPAASIVNRRVGLDMLEEDEPLVREIGLAGSSGHVETLLRLLDTVSEEDERVEIINALALIGDPRASEPLQRRYSSEGEDARFFTLKALDSIGGEARAFAREHGARDESHGCVRLAGRLE